MHCVVDASIVATLMCALPGPGGEPPSPPAPAPAPGEAHQVHQLVRDLMSEQAQLRSELDREIRQRRSQYAAERSMCHMHT